MTSVVKSVAFQAGRSAFIAGTALEFNPMPRGYISHVEWSQGWHFEQNVKNYEIDRSVSKLPDNPHPLPGVPAAVPGDAAPAPAPAPTLDAAESGNGHPATV